MKNRLMALLVIITIVSALSGCSSGVSQAQYDSAVAEKANLDRQISVVQQQLIAAQNQLYQLQSGQGAATGQTGPTDMSRISWQPTTYIDKKFGFKVTYPDTWKVATRNVDNTPFEAKFNSTKAMPGLWVGIISDTTDSINTQKPLSDLLSIWQDYKLISSGETTLTDGKTPASFLEFTATIDSQAKHIYALGYVNGDRWINCAVGTVESIVPWDGNLMRQIAHTLNKATANEIATGTVAPTTTRPTTGATTPATATAALSSYTDSTYNFTFKYDATWTGTWQNTNNPVSFGNPTYSDPSVRIYVVPKTWGATLADVLISSDMLKQYNPTTPPTNPAIDSTGADVTNGNGVKTTPILFHFTWTDGTTAQSKAYGFIKGDNWFIMFLTISSGWNLGIDSIKPDDVFNSWKFN